VRVPIESPQESALGYPHATDVGEQRATMIVLASQSDRDDSSAQIDRPF
jgi:hypothetical protein